MHAETIDTGAKVKGLRAFGPPEVVPLADFQGNGSVELGADGFWTVVKAVFMHYAVFGTPQERRPRLTWKTSDGVPFAMALEPVALLVSGASDVSFAVGVQAAGTQLGLVLLAPMPELVMVPGMTLTVDSPGAPGNDNITSVRAYLQRYQLVAVEHPTEG